MTVLFAARISGIAEIDASNAIGGSVGNLIPVDPCPVPVSHAAALDDLGIRKDALDVAGLRALTSNLLPLGR